MPRRRPNRPITGGRVANHHICNKQSKPRPTGGGDHGRREGAAQAKLGRWPHGGSAARKTRVDPTRPIARGTATSAWHRCRRGPMLWPGAAKPGWVDTVLTDGVELRGARSYSRIVRAWHASTSQLTLAVRLRWPSASREAQPRRGERGALAPWWKRGRQIPRGSPSAHRPRHSHQRPPSLPARAGALARRSRVGPGWFGSTRFGPTAPSCVGRGLTRESFARGTSPPAS